MEKVIAKGFTELSENEMTDVDGGAWWEVAVAAWTLYEVGYAIGKAIAHKTSK